MIEYHQPIHPMRIWTGTEDVTFIHAVFAIAISNDHEVEYLTINGGFYTRQTIKFAETYVNGEWIRLESHYHRNSD